MRTIERVMGWAIVVIVAILFISLATGVNLC